MFKVIVIDANNIIIPGYKDDTLLREMEGLTTKVSKKGTEIYIPSKYSSSFSTAREWQKKISKTINSAT